ncbi:MAG: type II secretion system protein [Chloracidobacterium sp.]|nr:type II secretion system protein [Chloracidobacterium sp.]
MKRAEQNDLGYSLLELVCTLAVLSILVMGTLPMAQNAVTRQKEQRLRETLREIRSAIDEFKRDTYGACAQGSSTTSNPTIGNQGAAADPRSRVYIDDCKIFGIDNLDRYPPSLEILVKGVRVKSRAPNLAGGSGLNDNSPQATEINQDKEVKKVYLREIPIDPMTGEKEWKLRSSYQDVDSDSWDDVNVFDVRTTAKGEALNGEKYSDW